MRVAKGNERVKGERVFGHEVSAAAAPGYSSGNLDRVDAFHDKSSGHKSSSHPSPGHKSSSHRSLGHKSSKSSSDRHLKKDCDRRVATKGISHSLAPRAPRKEKMLSGIDDRESSRRGTVGLVDERDPTHSLRKNEKSHLVEVFDGDDDEEDHEVVSGSDRYDSTFGERSLLL